MMQETPAAARLRLAATLGWTLLLAALFSQIEIQIEGPHGWAANLPTWRIEEHWMLDIFWGGRPMTGYHATMFSFIALVFHFPAFFARHWTRREESRVVGCIIVFWIVEDFLWFATSPWFGLAKFAPEFIPWHKHWFWFAPMDYWMFSGVAVGLLAYSMKRSAATGTGTGSA
jgi:hypothetical protein